MKTRIWIKEPGKDWIMEPYSHGTGQFSTKSFVGRGLTVQEISSDGTYMDIYLKPYVGVLKQV